MNRRKNKKHHAGDYVELGFDTNAQFVDGLDQDTLCAFMDDFIDMIESANLECGGGCNAKTFGMFVCNPARRGNAKRLFLSATEDHRKIVESWLKKEAEAGNRIVSYSVGELVDSWKLI